MTIHSLVLLLLGISISVFSDFISPPLAPSVIDTIRAANLDDVTTNATIEALIFEQSNWATGNISSDSFYNSLPSNATSETPPGSLLKLEIITNTSLYTTPPNTALSRIVYQTKNINGSFVPNSAYILWPYTPRKFVGMKGIPIVAWAHGTAGVFKACAPSHFRYLLYQFAAPFALATQGYAVVAPDYAGLGISSTADGVPIGHQWAASSAQANDLFYSVQAAQAAFPDLLAKKFVTMGHSQGGGVAVASAQRQAVEPVKGHLGSIAASPFLEYLIPGLDLAQVPGIGASLSNIAVAIKATFPGFSPSDVFTPEGLKRFELLQAIQGCDSVSEALVGGTGLVKESAVQNSYVQAYANITNTIGQKVANPLLIIQGLADPLIPAAVTESAVNRTCTSYPESQIEFWTLSGVTHVPALWATQGQWLDWIADRFKGVPVQPQCQSQTFSSVRPYDAYQVDADWIIRVGTPAFELVE